MFSSTDDHGGADTAVKMDAQYRLQRYVYDWSRKYYLLGRDSLLREIDLDTDETLLDMGCGTARNLCKLAYHNPGSELFGIDASQAMLDTALGNLRRHRLYTGNVRLQQALAQQVTPASFGRDEPFDHVLFSYVLSMIPDWQAAIEQAISVLRPGGCLHVVDFSDQQSMPAWFRTMLLGWLKRFHVHPEPALPGFLQSLTRQGGQLQLRHLPGRYALIACYRKPDPTAPTLQWMPGE
ncbi:class I SAM-dependent methyltransferase [Granulosicoccaceae sp. 1_MG-2023]|nr:class I SAM-dependent methyltransferase [Granulosicoccaceae sp. 1_MG-2023]